MRGCSVLIVCFKQKTAYEIRISDWSSDVCSSDLTLAHNALHGANRPHSVVHPVRHAIVVPEIELRKIPVQVLLRAVLIHALHAALEDGERALDRVRVDQRVFVIDVLALAVAGEAMAGEVQAEVPIVERLIRQTIGRACSGEGGCRNGEVEVGGGTKK